MMNKQFNMYFRAKAEQYRRLGANSLENELPELLEKITLPDINKSYLHFVADILMDLENYSAAAQLLKLIDAKFGLCDVGWNNLAFCQSKTGLQSEALSSYKNSIKINPSSLPSLRGACFHAIELDDPEAVRICRSLIHLKSGDIEIAVWYATALWNAELYSEMNDFISHYELKFGYNEELHAMRK